MRDHDDKLRRDDDGALGLVAKDAEHAWIVDPDDPVTAAVQRRRALRAYAALGCRHHGLFDFRVDPAGHAVLPRGLALLLLRPDLGGRGRWPGRGDRAARPARDLLASPARARPPATAVP